jgi:hypothetical protein
MANLKWFAVLLFLSNSIFAVQAEPHCPENVASVTFRFVNRHQMIVPVSVNHTKPYDFLLDTGTQETIVDVSLAAELQLKGKGPVAVDGVGSHHSAFLAQVDLLEAGSHSVANQEVVVYGLDDLESSNLFVRGILGEDFLRHFDVLIDNSKRLLCLDDTEKLRRSIHGNPIPWLTPGKRSAGRPLLNSIVLPVQLAQGLQPLRLKLDSGANAPFLFDAAHNLDAGAFRGTAIRGSGVDGAERKYIALPPQNMKIGSVEIPHVSFVTLGCEQRASTTSDFDGLLTLGLFKRIFIGHTDHFVVLETW